MYILWILFSHYETLSLLENITIFMVIYKEICDFILVP